MPLCTRVYSWMMNFTKPKRPFTLVIALLALVLLTSLALNFYLFSKAKQYYLQLNQVRLDPLGLNNYPSEVTQEDSLNTGKIPVVLFGDSRAASWPFPTHLKDFAFINRGIGAQTSAQALGRFEMQVRPLQPQVIIIQVGINDLKTIPLFPKQKVSIIADCQKNIKQMVAQSLDMGAIVILTTIFPVGEVPLERKIFWSDEVAQAVDEVNGYLRSLEKQEVIIFDAYSILADEDGLLKDEYAQDELHLNALGYEVLNNKLTNILASVVRE
jgi:lysophospholipase L1-like esterase